MDEVSEEVAEETLRQTVEESQKNQAVSDQLAAFLVETKTRFDEYFSHLGYVCFVFDKSNPDNHYLANISNVPAKGFLRKLMPFLAKYRQARHKLNRNRDKRFRRVK